jgi:hypothetical protein
LLAWLAVESLSLSLSLSQISLSLYLSLSVIIAGDPPAVLPDKPFLEFVACPHTFDHFSIGNEGGGQEKFSAADRRLTPPDPDSPVEA